MLCEASCHSLSDMGIENMYPSAIDNDHRDWINSLMSTPDGPADAVDQLIYAAFECAVSILRAAGSQVMFIRDLNAYQLDLFLFKDMGIGGILAKFISRMNDPVVGGYEGYFLPEPAATWYGSLYTDYMTYLDIADLDSVLAAQVASPGSQITIQFIALALEGAEEKARANEQTLNEYLENRTIADLVDQFTQEENCAWLTNHDFFRGNNGTFAVIREVSAASHDIMMGDTVSSDVSSEGDGQGQAATLDDTAATVQSGASQETAGLSSSSASAPRQFSEQRHHLASLPLRTSSRRSTTRHRIESDQLSKISQNRFSSARRHNLPTGSTQQRCTAVACGLTTSTQGRHVTVQVRGLISRSTRCSLARSILMQRTTPRLQFQAFCRTLMTTSWETMTHLWRTSTGLWSIDYG